MYKTNNLDVFILTYNRSKLLERQLISICNQFATGFDITILNNASTDNTVEVVEKIKSKYSDRNIKLINHHKNIGAIENFNFAKKISNKEYTYIIHDDDIIHPVFIEKAMRILNKYNTVGCLSSRYKFEVMPSLYSFECPRDTFTLFPKGKSVPLFVICDNVCWQNMIYKTDVLKNSHLDYSKYGKHCDQLQLYNIFQQTDVISLDFIGIKIGWGGDTVDINTRPSEEQIKNIILGKIDFYKKYGLIGLFAFSKNVRDDLSRYDKLFNKKSILYASDLLLKYKKISFLQYLLLNFFRNIIKIHIIIKLIILNKYRKTL